MYYYDGAVEIVCIVGGRPENCERIETICISDKLLEVQRRSVLSSSPINNAISMEANP